jgi:SAM-dependent methyltransferase
MLRRLARYAKSVVLLNRTRAQATLAQAQIAACQATIRELFELVQDLEPRLGRFDDARLELTRSIAKQSETLAHESRLNQSRLHTYDQKIAAISGAFDTLAKVRPANTMSQRSDHPELSEQSSLLLTNFYVALEAKFRGTTGDITQRQTIYLPDIDQAVDRTERRMVLDLGCGRGEWLALLRDRSIESVGVDTNEGQLAEARANGLAVHHGDALQFLRQQKEATFAAVTAFHIFEHLPFAVLAEWLVEIRRVLIPGGVLIAETPNPENLIVGANTFHLDPTHVRPLPSGVLSILVETVGLDVQQIRPLHPHTDLGFALKELPERTAYLLYGYQDYGLIAVRSQTKAV